MQQNKPSAVNLPNALTLFRFLLIPVFIYLMSIDQMMPALAVFIIASLTDILDGWIARKYNLITDFGKLFDPLADKLMVLSLLMMFVVKDIAPFAAIAILFIKEMLLMIGGILLLKRNLVVYSQRIGKIAQFVTVLALILCFFHKQFNAWGYPIHLYVLWTSVGLAILSFIFYFRTNGVQLLNSNAKKTNNKEGEQ